MRLFNTKFDVKVGDRLEYVHEAVEWINNYRKKMNNSAYLSAKELNKRNPTVVRVEYSLRKDKKIFVWVYNDKIYSGLSGVIDGSKTDIWCLDINGRFDSQCTYPIFRVKKEK